MKILIAILSVAIVLLCWGDDLSAQEKKDDKRLEISCYFGGGGQGSEGEYGLSPFEVPSYGLGLEYYLTPRISLEGEINYLPNIASVGIHLLGGNFEKLIKIDDMYRLMWDINLLFYFDLTRIKRPAMRWFLTVGTGYQYDREEYTFVSRTTLEQHKYGYGEFWVQLINFGAGFKVNITRNWALRLLYKINRFAGESLQTARLALGLSYRF